MRGRCCARLLIGLLLVAFGRNHRRHHVEGQVLSKHPIINNNNNNAEWKHPTSTATSTPQTQRHMLRTIGQAVVLVRTRLGEGTGIIVSEQGIVLTCYHVLAKQLQTKRSGHILVVLPDKRIYMASVLGCDTVLDVAVLQLLRDDRHHITIPVSGNSKEDHDDLYLRQFASFIPWFGNDLPPSIEWDAPLPVARVGCDNNNNNNNNTYSFVAVGAQVLAIGQSLDHGLEITSGIVSGFHYEHTMVRKILTDATIFQGFSGGPLIDLETGSVVGLNQHSLLDIATVVVSRGQKRRIARNERNVAIPMDEICTILPRLMDGKHVTHATLGVELVSLTHDLPRGTLTSGAEIIQIENDKKWSLARWWQAKLKRGDVVVEVNGTKVETAMEAHRIIDQSPVGEKLEVVVMRKMRTILPGLAVVDSQGKRMTVYVIPKAVLGRDKNRSHKNSLWNLWNQFRQSNWDNYRH